MITDIDQVMDISVSALKLLGRTESTIKEYQQRFSVIAKISNRFHDESTDLIEFLEKYDQLTLSYLQGIHASARVIRGHKRAIRLLRIAAKSQNIALVAEEFKHALEPSKYETLSVSVIESLEKFKVFLKNKGYRHATILSYCEKTLKFVRYLNTVDELNLRTLTTEQVMNATKAFIESTQFWSHKALIGPKCYLNWLYNNKITNENLSYLLRIQTAKKENEVKFFTQEQVKKMLKYLDLNKSEDIMMHAIITLVNYTGIRGCDILNLRIQDLDWKSRKITFLQSKTGNNVVLPILDCVAKSLSKYLLSVRPFQAREFVFVQLKFPYKQLNKNILGNKFATLRNKVFGEENYQGYGLHALRRGLGTRMFRSGIALPLIQEILGHKDEKSCWAYIQPDIEQLRTCCLPLPEGVTL